jgi:hypothetical protein
MARVQSEVPTSPTLLPKLATVEWGGMDWICLTQDREEWRALVNVEMNLQVLKSAGKLSSHCITCCPSGNVQLHKWLSKYKCWIKIIGNASVVLKWLYYLRYTHLHSFNIIIPQCVPPSAKFVEGIVHHQRVHFCWLSAVTALQHE